MCVMLAACQPRSRDGTYEDVFFSVLKFKKFDAMQDFITFVESNSDVEVFNNELFRLNSKLFKSDYEILASVDRMTSSQANEIVENLTETKIVKPKEGVVFADFDNEYIFSREDDSMSLFYAVDGSKYWFRYYFDYDKDIENDKKFVFKKVSIDSVQFNLYKYDNGQLYGSFMIGTTRVNVQVASYDLNSVKFDWFEFVTLSRNLESQGD